MSAGLKNMRNTSITRLTERVLNNEAGAFDDLVKIIYEPGLQYAKSILKNEHLAEDAMQESLYECFRSLAGLQHKDAFIFWFRKIIFKQCDRIRRKKSYHEIILQDIDAVFHKQDEPHELLIRFEIRQRIQEAIQNLPYQKRKIATLKFEEGLRNQEIAYALQISEFEVKNRIRQIRIFLRNQLKDLHSSADVRTLQFRYAA